MQYEHFINQKKARQIQHKLQLNTVWENKAVSLRPNDLVHHLKTPKPFYNQLKWLIVGLHIFKKNILNKSMN